MGDEHIPMALDTGSLPGGHINPQSVPASESLKLDLCLATFLVEAVSSIGTQDQQQWKERLGITNTSNHSTEPDVQSLKEIVANTPLQSTFVEQNLTAVSLAEVRNVYMDIKAKTNVRARLHLMSWAVSDIPRSRLKMQAAMLCNLSKAHQYLISKVKNNEYEGSSVLKWVSSDVLNLWLGKDTMRNVFLFYVFPPHNRYLTFEYDEIEKILREEFLATLSLFGDAGINLHHDTSPVHLLNLLINNSLTSQSELEIQRGPLIPLPQSEVARNLIYAHEIQEKKHRRNSDFLTDSRVSTFSSSKEASCLGENLLCGPFDGNNLKMVIENNDKRLKNRRDVFEKKISLIVKEPLGTITKGNWGRQFVGVTLIFAVLVIIGVTYMNNPVDRKHKLERIFDAFEAGTILTAMAAIIFKVISPDPSILRNSLIGIKLLVGFDQIRNYCKIRSRREFCFLLAGEERDFCWLSRENLSFINGSLTGEIRKDDGIRLFELARMGFTVEGRYMFNPYTEKYFEIKKDSPSEGRLKAIDPNRMPTFSSLNVVLERRLPCSYLIH